jgi:catechol 2,3-dioxygenase-like lactoylglutathione lyase family enzyme
MRVRRIGFVGTRTTQVAATTAFFSEVLGLEVVREDREWSILQLPSGRFDFLEVFGADYADERVAPAAAPLFIAFIVDDLLAAHAEVRESGVEVSEIVWDQEDFGEPVCEGLGWFFVRAPDGTPYVIQQSPD